MEHPDNGHTASGDSVVIRHAWQPFSFFEETTIEELGGLVHRGCRASELRFSVREGSNSYEV